MEGYKSFMNDKLAKLLFKQGSKWEDHLHQIETAHNPVTLCQHGVFKLLSWHVSKRHRNL